jgi:outer membrane protein assembly factor BamB
LFLVAVLALLTVPARAAELHVPADHNTIQAAIDAAVNGDTVIVADGTHSGEGNRDIDFRSKAITVRSENGPENCIIDCQNLGRGFRLNSILGGNPVIDGFTIINGYARSGGAIHNYGSSSIISNCIMTSNYAKDKGGAIYSRYGSVVVTNCTISENRSKRGGGIWRDEGAANLTVANCSVTANRGGGISCGSRSNLTVTGCTISGNIGAHGSGIRCHQGSLTVNNSIVWNNALLEIGTVGEVNVIVTYSNVQGGWEGQGNIDIDPLLRPDGHLRSGSPCIDAGDPNCDFTSQVDVDGEPRLTGSGVDMGADEFLDTDTDGLPDWWESKYFGSATAPRPHEDPDGDGLTNIAEYEIYSSDPTIASVIYYVDVENGDDSYDGRAPLWDGEHGPKQTIQAAIDTAIVTDTVIVAPGRYMENIDFQGKGITVRSSDPGDWDLVNNTIIDGSEGDGEQGSCVVFDDGEGSDSILAGLTLTRGSETPAAYAHRYHLFTKGPTYAGGGILCVHSSPTIERCNITDNGSQDEWGNPYTGFGGGIALLGNCQATIRDSFIVNNGAIRLGGGILISSNTPETATSTFENCTIANNVTFNIDHYNDRDGNRWYYRRYQLDCYDTQPRISNTIIWSNDGPHLQRGLFIADPSRVKYSCVRDAYIFDGSYEGADPCDLTSFEGNIDRWPHFVQTLKLDTQEQDYHLLRASPCINAGDPNFAAGLNETDIDGQPRVMAGRVDIGADETVPQIVVTRPVAGDIWTAGSLHQVEWTSYGAAAVDILLSGDAGGAWRSIENAVPDTGSYTWRIAGAVRSEQAVVSVVPTVPDANVIVIDSGVFAIRPYRSPRGLATGPRRPLKTLGPQFGCVKWQFHTEGPVTAAVTLGPKIRGMTRAYIACEDGKVYTLDAEDGTLLSSYDTNSPLLASAAVSHFGTVYVAAADGRLYAIDKRGRLLWMHTTDEPIFASPVVSHGQIYACSEDGSLYALAQDGSELWRFETAGFAALGGSTFATPAVGSDGTLYLAGLYDPNLYSLNPDDGSIKWVCNFEFAIDPCDPNSATKGGWPFAAPAIAEDGTIYQTLLYDSHLYAIEPQTGTITWAANLADPCSGLFDPNDAPVLEYADGWSSPVLGPDGSIYVSLDDPYLRAVQPNGTIKWAAKLGTIGAFTLTVGDDGLVYAASDDHYLYVVDHNGEQVAQFQGDHWLSHPVIAPGRTIIVSDANNTVWAISQETCDGDTPVLDGSAETETSEPIQSKGRKKHK